MHRQPSRRDCRFSPYILDAEIQSPRYTTETQFRFDSPPGVEIKSAAASRSLRKRHVCLCLRANQNVSSLAPNQKARADGRASYDSVPGARRRPA